MPVADVKTLALGRSQEPLGVEDILALTSKGRGLYDDLLRRVQDPRDDPDLPGLGPNHHFNIRPLDTSLDAETIAAFNDAGHPVTNYILVAVRNLPSPLTAHIAKLHDPYQNFAHTGGKALLCMDNDASRDALFGQKGVGRLYMSDALAETFAREHGADWRDLEAIWRMNVQNQQTRGLVAALFGDRTDPQDFPAGDDSFFALLGSPNGKAVCRMLATYPDMFGRKSISKVRVFPIGSRRVQLNICWFLEKAPSPPTPTPSPAPATPDHPLSRKERRQHHRRLASQQLATSPSTPTRSSRRSHGRNISAASAP
ncbi:hypothetical protein F5144DRAFT_551992 [Chaetomium tenue]|uniref:Uncharacterized protein n=1 Tax=Chaetomium tenue TaxID=1854479 RepID=A0ACB7NXS2_9PEZI|nr:hypothetical protein F5144DRAFT_551992 [Chaetomium globosum]